MSAGVLEGQLRDVCRCALGERLGLFHELVLRYHERNSTVQSMLFLYCGNGKQENSRTP